MKKKDYDLLLELVIYGRRYTAADIESVPVDKLRKHILKIEGLSRRVRSEILAPFDDAYQDDTDSVA